MNINVELARVVDKNGLQQINIRLTEKGKSKYIYLPVKVHKAQFEKGKIIKHPLKNELNKIIELKVADLQHKALVAQMSNEKNIIDKLLGKDVVKLKFDNYAIDVMRRLDHSKTIGTVKAWASQLRQTLLYQPNLMLQDVTSDWLYNYELHLRKKGLTNGGIRKRMQFIGKIVNDAIRNDIIIHSPFKVYQKPVERPVQKEWLTQNEIDLIIDLTKNGKLEKLHSVANWFLFCCFTGLRYSDIENFNFEKSITEGRVILYTQKTGEVVSILIGKRIANVLEKIKGTKVITNQKGNQHLKAIAAHCNITKNLSWHVARHTFATQCSLAGIRQEVAQKLLGHSSIKTTAIYYKIVNTTIDDEVAKLG